MQDCGRRCQIILGGVGKACVPTIIALEPCVPLYTVTHLHAQTMCLPMYWPCIRGNSCLERLRVKLTMPSIKPVRASYGKLSADTIAVCHVQMLLRHAERTQRGIWDCLHAPGNAVAGKRKMTLNNKDHRFASTPCSFLVGASRIIDLRCLYGFAIAMGKGPMVPNKSTRH